MSKQGKCLFAIVGFGLILGGCATVPMKGIWSAETIRPRRLYIAIVIEALIRVSKRALKSREAHVLAIAAFLGLFALKLPFPVIILAAGLWGFLRTPQGATDGPPPPAALARSLRAATIWLTIWLLPLGLLILTAPTPARPSSTMPASPTGMRSAS